MTSVASNIPEYWRQRCYNWLGNHGCFFPEKSDAKCTSVHENCSIASCYHSMLQTLSKFYYDDTNSTYGISLRPEAIDDSIDPMDNPHICDPMEILANPDASQYIVVYEYPRHDDNDDDDIEGSEQVPEPLKYLDEHAFLEQYPNAIDLLLTVS